MRSSTLYFCLLAGLVMTALTLKPIEGSNHNLLTNQEHTQSEQHAAVSRHAHAHSQSHHRSAAMEEKLSHLYGSSNSGGGLISGLISLIVSILCCIGCFFVILFILKKLRGNSHDGGIFDLDAIRNQFGMGGRTRQEGRTHVVQEQPVNAGYNSNYGGNQSYNSPNQPHQAGNNNYPNLY